MVIQITDDLKAQANVSAGSRIPGVQVQNAFQIQGWLEVNGIFFGNAGLSIMIPPFGVGGGDCLFDTGSLFIFAGPQNSDADNVLMVLWVSSCTRLPVIKVMANSTCHPQMVRSMVVR
jgi:hypothetical protein